MAETTDTDLEYIVYYLEIADLINEIYMLSHYKGKNLRSQDKEPASRTDEVTITDDEEEILLRLLKNAANEVYKNISGYCRDIVDSFMFDGNDEIEAWDPETEYDADMKFYYGDPTEELLYNTLADATPPGTDPEDTDYFEVVPEWTNTYNRIRYILNYDEDMSTDTIEKILAEAIEDAIVKHVLLAWYKTINEVNFIALANEEYDTAIRKVNSTLWHSLPASSRRRANELM